jgi:hypothetical protein
MRIQSSPNPSNVDEQDESSIMYRISYLHCLDEEGYETLDFEQFFCIADHIQGFVGQTDRSITHRLPYFLNLSPAKRSALHLVKSNGYLHPLASVDGVLSA